MAHTGSHVRRGKRKRLDRHSQMIDWRPICSFTESYGSITAFKQTRADGDRRALQDKQSDHVVEALEPLVAMERVDPPLVSHQATDPQLAGAVTVHAPGNYSDSDSSDQIDTDDEVEM